MSMPKKDRTGERFISNEGCEMVIIDYKNTRDVTVQFQDKYKAKVHTQYGSCRNGEVKNPYHPSVYKVGFIGQGEYKVSINGRHTKYYEHWKSMLERCYDSKYKEKQPTYKDCFANKETHCFQDFCKWFDKNYYEIEGEVMCLDKDILIKGNKEYSFNTMVFVPQRINSLFIKRDAMRGDLPIGVSYCKTNNKYQAHCKTLEDKKYLGLYNTPHEAFLAYKTFKEAYIKQVADEYKDKIPKKLYDAMYAWTVEETD